MSLDTTASNGLIPIVKSDTPACRWFLIGVKGIDMRLQAEFETEIFVNDEGSVTISQEGHVCPSCGVAEDAIVVFGTTSRLRTIANELMRLAAELERGRQ